MAKFNIRVQHEKDTEANWEANNPILLDGEIIFVDTAEGEFRMKIGDGVSTYVQLPFADESIKNYTDLAIKNTLNITNDNGIIDAGSISERS